MKAEATKFLISAIKFCSADQKIGNADQKFGSLNQNFGSADQKFDCLNPHYFLAGLTKNEGQSDQLTFWSTQSNRYSIWLFQP